MPLLVIVMMCLGMKLFRLWTAYLHPSWTRFPAVPAENAPAQPLQPQNLLHSRKHRQ